MSTSRNASRSTCSAIPAVIFGPLLKACHFLDFALFSSNSTSQSQIPGWHTLDPLAYLTSEPILEAWERGLELLSQRYQEGVYTPEMFEGMLKAMLPSVESLEEERNKLVLLLENERRSGGVNSKALEEVCEVVEKRCRVLETAFRRLENGTR
jgi:hypothetical protein